MPQRIPTRTRPPAYRARKGYDQAIVTLRDSVTKRPRDYWLGSYGTPSSRELYVRLIAEWEANGRRLPTAPSSRKGGEDDPTVAELIAKYWSWAQSYYSIGHLRALKPTLRVLRQFFGSLSACEFGPSRLRLLRDDLIRGDATGDPPRRAWSRTGINMAVQRIRHVFRWAVGRELVPPAIYQTLCALEPLRRGRSAARETTRVEPVPDLLLNATCRYLSQPVRALVDLQLLTGARPGELLQLRPSDIEIDQKSKIWSYEPERHKNSFREQSRVIYFGPRAQEILRPFLHDRPRVAYMFSPRDAETERRESQHKLRKTPLSCGNRPGSNRKETTRRKPGERYTTASYNRAIRYACERAFPPPAPLAPLAGESKEAWKQRLTPEQQLELREWRNAHNWHVHQLRHNAATSLRREFGLEAAQLTLGHASAQITDAVYAERDKAKVIEIMRRIG